MKKIILLFLCLIIFNTLLEAKIIYEYKGEKNSIIRNYKLKAISNIGKFKESFTIEGYLVDEDNQPIKNKEVYIYSTLERNGIIAKTNSKGKFRKKINLAEKSTIFPSPMINITFISLNDCSLFLYKLKKGEDIEDTIFNPVGLHFERNFEDGNVELTIINNKGRKVIETELKTNIIKLRTSKLSGKYFRQQKKNALVETKKKLKANNINDVNVEETILDSDEILKDDWQDIIEDIIKRKLEKRTALTEAKKKLKANNFKITAEEVILNSNGELEYNYQSILEALVLAKTRLKKTGINNIDIEKEFRKAINDINYYWDYALECKIKEEALKQAKIKLKNKKDINDCNYDDYDIEEIICEKEYTNYGEEKIKKVKDNWKQLINKEIQKVKQYKWQRQNEIKKWKNSAHVVEKYINRCPRCFRYSLVFALLMKTGDRYHSYAFWYCQECHFFQDQLNGF